MPTRRLPQTNRQRYTALKAGKDRKDMVPAPLVIPYTAATMTWLDTFIGPFKVKIDGVDAALIVQATASTLVKTTHRTAALFILHFYDALQNAILRGTLDAEIRPGYGLAVNDTNLPSVKTEADINFWGDKINIGETARVAGGGTPITFPSLAEVNTAVGNFHNANLQQANAKEAYDAAQEAVEADNPEADLLILKMWNETEAAFDTGNKPSLRRKARDWGVVYEPTPGEVLSPEDFSIFGNISESGTGLAINEAEITVVEPNVTVLSDNKGNYFVGVQPPATYTVQVHKAGYQDKEITGVVVTAEAVTALNIELIPQALSMGSVSGQVIHAGVGVSATVMVDGMPGGVSTDPMGNYTINNVPAGAQVVRATLTSNPAMVQTQNATVIAGGTVTVNFNFA